jgi:DICT domain-containing protein
MNILGVLYHLQQVFHTNRGVGHSTFARTISKIDGILICGDRNSAHDFARPRPNDEKGFKLEAVSIQDERELQRLQGWKRPVVLDNYAVMKLCDEAIHRIQEQAEDIKRINSEWHKQNLANDKERQKLGSEIYELQHYTLAAKNNQIDALERENLALKIKLNARRISHIRVTRKKQR